MKVNSHDAEIFYRVDGPNDGPTIMFGNSLGTDMGVWDAMLPHLAPNLRLVRFDKRGHGQSSVPAAPYDIDTLVDDAQAVIDETKSNDIVFIGLSIGGLIAQGLAARKNHNLKAIVLMDTAAKLGTAESWQTRIDAIKENGLSGIADAVLERWFAPSFLKDDAQVSRWRDMLLSTPTQGYLGCCAAIANADFTNEAAELTLPTIAMVGEYDGASPPELVRNTAQLCDAHCYLIKNAGHLPCVEQPQKTATLINEFMEEIGHV